MVPLSLYTRAPIRPPKIFDRLCLPFVSSATRETVAVDAKAGCLYPNNSRSLFCFEALTPRIRHAIVWRQCAGHRRRTRHFDIFIVNTASYSHPNSEWNLLAALPTRKGYWASDPQRRECGG